ncbi:hypothetical protein Desaf_0414 [Desulfocurvibacter africanus subsp. africanus str. Walvis Bay]|uniref:Uncharacterized protein n=1 Tax=Desulfocurvibacter africanus subsp. africanus str. Walvis Bay TaxID=690850 RepID=F3YVN3_DESAF|nr:hypothetical protein Desaf_0414 [Desulfocurvibacter africanus subsp. africanus str. Walvis Bay]
MITKEVTPMGTRYAGKDPDRAAVFGEPSRPRPGLPAPLNHTERSE